MNINIRKNIKFSYLKGFLTNVFLCDSEYDVMGYYSSTKLRIILVLNHKQNLENYNESIIKQVIFTQVKALR